MLYLVIYNSMYQFRDALLRLLLHVVVRPLQNEHPRATAELDRVPNPQPVVLVGEDALLVVVAPVGGSEGRKSVET